MSYEFDPWGLLKNAWVAITGIILWVFKRHVDEDTERAKALSIVQQTYATRDDITELHRKIDDNHREVMRELLK